MYMPGRLRTGSRPSRTWISSPVYLLCAIFDPHCRRYGLIDTLSTLGVGERLDLDRRRHHDELRPLDDLVAPAASSLDLLGIGGDLEPLAALLGLDHELVALGAGDEADHQVVVVGLDHGDAAAGALELGDLVGLAQQHVAL